MDFILEDFDNLPDGVGNIIFDGQSEVQDEIDVFDLQETQAQVFDANKVTFLDGLDNSVDGLDNSNDVINGQAGDDTLDGRSGNELLRGNDGNDLLFGGSGNDTALGGVGLDTLKGQDGDDSLNGGDNNDLLQGGNNNDRLDGQNGNDYAPRSLRIASLAMTETTSFSPALVMIRHPVVLDQIPSKDKMVMILSMVLTTAI